MLSLEVMGLVALGVMWVNTLLIAATVVSAATEARRRRRSLRPLGLALAGCAGMLFAAVGVSALALTRPYFGSWSTAGGALGLVYFLLVQPAGVALCGTMRRREHGDARG